VAIDVGPGVASWSCVVVVISKSLILVIKDARWAELQLACAPGSSAAFARDPTAKKT